MRCQSHDAQAQADGGAEVAIGMRLVARKRKDVSFLDNEILSGDVDLNAANKSRQVFLRTREMRDSCEGEFIEKLVALIPPPRSHLKSVPEVR